MSSTSPRLQQLEGFLEGSPDEPFIIFAIAKEHEGLGNEDQALANYLKLTKISPDYVGTYYHLGKLYEQLDKIPTAFQTYKTGMAVAKKMGDHHALSELAGAKMGLGDDEDFE